jgi:uncharacterized protein involved in exopolysaccharide biosynthesis
MPSTDPARQSPVTGAITGPPAHQVTLVGLLSVLLRHRLLVAGVALACSGGAILYALLQPRSYTATSSFMPQTSRGAGALSGLAAQLGFQLPAAVAGEQSPAFYADLLESRELLGAAVDTRYEFRSDTGMVSGTLIEVQRVRGRPATRRERTIAALKRSVKPSVAQQSGVVKLEVTAHHAALAQRINQRLLDLVNRFNLESRQSQAGAERRFTEQRLAEVKSDLRETEDRLQDFLQRNRDFKSSPLLTFAQLRLQREVERQQQLYVVLTQAYEQARIEEVRDTPVITIIERPEVPVLPEPRGLLIQGVLGLLIGGLLGGLLAFGREFLARSRQEDPLDFEEFASLRRQAREDLLHPWRPLGRVARSLAGKR